MNNDIGFSKSKIGKPGFIIESNEESLKKFDIHKSNFNNLNPLPCHFLQEIFNPLYQIYLFLCTLFSLTKKSNEIRRELLPSFKILIGEHN
jgi:hypothetical protein